MDELLTRLKNDFSDFSCRVDGIELYLRTMWKGQTNGIEKVTVYLSGCDPLTGLPLPRETMLVNFSRTKTSHTSRALNLHGDYLLQFEAIGSNGVNLGSFRDAYPIHIENNSVRPYIRYSFSNAGEWTQLRLESNCWRRCSGHLWVDLYGKLFCLHTDLPREIRHTVFYFPIEAARPLLITDDDGLPRPEKA